jgi:glycerate kinase
MSGAGEGKKLIGKANVYIHEKGKSRATITHVDIELEALNKIIKPGENSYAGGKAGGIFIGLKKEMIQRAESLIKKRKR